ncbi:putative methyltransferase [Heracleum sosnowskyi]|uniref:Methyltransferase n=1 Tax=Heracleum sosnowskyi TaxID=360622 RepID=A0AAD8IRK6_9APIA|nr:putative methyltransferase [Heracleum sosnowskyi]
MLLESHIAPKSTVDLVTIAQALHWFDNPNFYQQVKYVLKKSHGVVAAWCYTVPQVNVAIDAVFKPFYSVHCEPYWDPACKKVDNEYRSIDFPFEPADGLDHTEFTRAWGEDGTQSKTVVFPVYLRIGKVGSLDI